MPKSVLEAIKMGLWDFEPPRMWIRASLNPRRPCRAPRQNSRSLLIVPRVACRCGIPETATRSRSSASRSIPHLAPTSPAETSTGTVKPAAVTPHQGVGCLLFWRDLRGVGIAAIELPSPV